MRSPALINSLVLVLLFIASSCVSSPDGDPALTSTEEQLLAPEPKNPVQSLGEESSLYNEGQLDANEVAVGSDLPCGLSILPFDDHTDYWIRSCYEYETRWQVIASDEGEVYDGEIHTIEAFRTVSGSVRGRVLRLRRL